jgi:hypothetical protein
MSNNFDLIETIAAMLTSLRERGWEYPIYAVSVSTNSCVDTPNEYTADGAAGYPLVLEPPETPRRLPVYMMFVDSAGRNEPAMLTLEPPPSPTAIAVQL